jgi:S-DNA-T family DNA segregation ATPase FtsK/SpoIIIE
MANKKTGNKAPQKNTKPAPKTQKPVRMSQKQIDELEAQQAEIDARKKENSQRIISIVIFAVSLLFFFIAVISGDGVWNFVHNIYIGLFGWVAAIVFPLFCLAYSILFTAKKTERSMTFEAVLICILVLLMSTFIHVVANQNGADFVDSITSAFNDAPNTFNGGLFGATIGWLLLTMGKAPAIIVDLILVVVDIMLLLISFSRIQQSLLKRLLKRLLLILKNVVSADRIRI